ncbi:MAG: tRNA uridine-5-carboxymethylaminomethyl(34) synthesis GTPase MnmE [Burkholderiales bacterium]|nr:tRNA uridine-5-carboxymethylaminomethyl(34) synthesis GTPase MnmE [Burkholderiales bacterium]
MQAPTPEAIIAIATAPGRGGVGVVRVSGPTLGWLVQAWFGRDLVARQATYLPFLAADGQTLDQGLALYFPAPHSYTGEDVLELQAHGGPVVLQLLVKRCLELAHIRNERLRLAEPGEFTRRAFLNDKLDLAQAEAVADLIEAQTAAAARSAAASLAGAFSQEIHTLVEQLIHLRLLVEATLDFPEEEIEFLQQADALGQLETIEQQLARVLACARQGALLRDGVKVVLAGVPNAGKSSLLNALAGEEVAIVTPIAGTTRDKVQQSINIEGIPLLVIDTAGLRETSDTVEAIGVARTWQEVERADVILHLIDLTAPDEAANQRIAERFPAALPVLRVFNKIDTVGLEPRVAGNAVYVSAQTHAGLDLLQQTLLRLVGVEHTSDSVFIARARHLQALQAAQNHLQQARQQAYDEHGHITNRQLDLFAEELRLAQEQLNSITGEFGADDLLGRIFSQFCIGK